MDYLVFGGVSMHGIIEVYDNYTDLGIKNRKITEGEEIELVRQYIDYRKNIFSETSEKNMAIFLESKVGDAYPDVVFVEYNPNNYQNWNSIRNELENKELKILYHLYRTKGLDATDIVSQLGITWKDCMLSVEKLLDSNLITRKNQQWILVDEKKIYTTKIEAVEAKLNQWDQVLQQSILNRNFATESYALSIGKGKPKKEVMSKFNKFGIGVYLKNGDSFEIIKQAEKVDIPRGFNSLIFNEWIGRILNSNGKELNAIR